jgi:hypothetical protein
MAGNDRVLGRNVEVWRAINQDNIVRGIRKLQ